MTGLDHQSKVREKFNQFDTDNDGFIDMKEILNYYSESEEEAVKIHKLRYLADKNKDNLLNFEDFESFLSKGFTLSADDAEGGKFEKIDTNPNVNIS